MNSTDGKLGPVVAGYISRDILLGGGGRHQSGRDCHRIGTRGTALCFGHSQLVLRRRPAGRVPSTVSKQTEAVSSHLRPLLQDAREAVF
jgi:hypothetical protein